MRTPGDHTVDLHTHSSYSDGLLSPAALVAEAAARGVRFLGLTDHDTVAGIPEAQQAGADLGVEVIPGVELSTSLSGGEDVHLLGYFVDVANRAFWPDWRASLGPQERPPDPARLAGRLAWMRAVTLASCPSAATCRACPRNAGRNS